MGKLQSAAGDSLRLAALNRSDNVFTLQPSGSHIALSSMGSPDALRGIDLSIALLSEVAFWKSSVKFDPNDYIRSVCGSINSAPDTLVIMESTANGVGSFFHREWLRCVDGEGDKEPLFVPWYDCGYFFKEVDDPEALCTSMDAYEWGLWQQGLTLEQICWYKEKRREYTYHSQMMAEYPSTHFEAFVASASSVFVAEHVERLRLEARTPLATGDLTGASASGVGALRNIAFHPAASGPLAVWTFPQNGRQYIVGVDIGGVSDSADWSVVTVMDRTPGNKPEVVASWRGHIDHDLLAWKCAAVAAWYNKALLVIESNTLETEHTDGDPSSFILNRLARHYPNLYHRTDASGHARIPGMHINRATKGAVITELIAAVRDNDYVERDHRACDELLQYERKENGAFGARDGCHDDLLMTRALIFGALAQMPPTHTGRIAAYIEST